MPRELFTLTRIKIVPHLSNRIGKGDSRGLKEIFPGRTHLFIVVLLCAVVPCLSQTPDYPLQRGDTDLVTEVSWSPQDNLILTSSFDENSLRLWDATSGRVIWKSEIGFLQDNLELHAIRHTAWTNDQRFIVTGNDNGKLQLWEATTGKLIWNIKAHGDSVTSIAVSPDNRFVLRLSLQYLVTC